MLLSVPLLYHSMDDGTDYKNHLRLVCLSVGVFVGVAMFIRFSWNFAKWFKAWKV